MQTTRLLCLSLLLNIVLFVLTTGLVVQRRTGEHSAVNEAATTASGAARSSPTIEVVTNTTMVTNTFHWSQIESTNYVTYRDNLRAVGVPEQTIADLIERDLRAAFALQEPAPTRQHYWRDSQAAEYLEAVRAWQQTTEVNKILLALGLPAPCVRPPCGVAAADFAFLPVAWQSRAATIEARYLGLMEERRIRSQGRYTDEDLDYLAQLDAQHEADLRALLGPASFFEYQVRNSPIAHRLREITAGFDPTEDEFRRVFEIEQRFEEVAQSADETDAAAWRSEQLAAALGPDRAAEFLKSQDPTFQDAYALASRYDLEAGAADALYQARRNLEDRVQAIMEQVDWTEHQKTQAVLAVQAQTLAELAPHLGGSLDRIGSDWLSVSGQAIADRDPGLP